MALANGPPPSRLTDPDYPPAVPQSLPTPSPFDYLDQGGQQDGADSLLSSTSYAQKSTRIMELYRDLLKLGANQEFDLPKVVVIGSQSTGKSSLVEAVGGINVPRDAGICTRCPMQCTMTRSDIWSAQVDIEWRYDAQNREIMHPKPRSGFSPRIFNKGEVEIWIRRAQAAILAPHRSWEEFTRMTPEKIKNTAIHDIDTLPFSRNTIHVTLTDPDAAELSFVDLPGLVQNVESTRTRDLVEKLVKEHIMLKDSLILIAMPMTDDIQNQGAVALAKTVDPRGQRIVGVITKPDMVTEGSTGSKKIWKDIFENRISDSRLAHGYFCVRLLDDSERDSRTTRQEADRIANRFFETTEPWNQVDPNRLGVSNLVKHISALLIRMILQKVPSLRTSTQAVIRDCLAALSRLPPVYIPRGDPAVEIHLKISEFSTDLERSVFGERRKSYVQENRALYVTFKENIEGTIPDFYPAENSLSNPGLVKSQATPLNYLDVRKVIRESIGWELPGHVPFDATKVLVKQHTDAWEAPTIACFQAVHMHLRNFLDTLLDIHFGRYVVLKGFIKQTALKELAKCKDEVLDSVHKILTFESDPLFTLNTEMLEEKRNTWRTRYVNSSNQYGFGSKYNDELTVICTVQAYFEVASKRFIDYVPLCIEHELNQQFCRRLKSALLQAITKVHERMTVHDLLSEDPIIANQRAALVAKRDRLQEIKRTLDEFPTVDPDDMMHDPEPLTPHAFAQERLPVPCDEDPPAFTEPQEPQGQSGWASIVSSVDLDEPPSAGWDGIPISPTSGKKKKKGKGAM